MDSLLQSLIVSASLGALIGLIRQWGEQQDVDKSGDHFAGLRTFVLWSLIGYTAAYVNSHHVPYAFLVALALIGFHLLLHGMVPGRREMVGLTTGAATIITLLVGGLVYWGNLLFAVMLTALTVVVLGIKQYSHAWTRRFKDEDIRSTLQFVAVTGVVLPLVPNQGYGPYEALNPYSIWLMVVLISGLGFIGYILMRLMGAHAGVTMTGIVGGLASSTATTLAFSRESKAYPELSRSFALAIVIACTIMLGRVLVILGFIYPPFIQSLWLPFLIMALPGLIYATIIAFFGQAKKESMETPDLKNPLGLSVAIKFAIIYGLVSFLVKVFSQTELSEGLLALSFISGLTDMDAIALSITNNLKEGNVAVQIAVQAVILSAIANTVLKAGLVFSFGDTQLRKHISIALGMTVLAGAGAFFFV